LRPFMLGILITICVSSPSLYFRLSDGQKAGQALRRILLTLKTTSKNDTEVIIE
jgi:hypothetical protein